MMEYMVSKAWKRNGKRQTWVIFTKPANAVAWKPERQEYYLARDAINAANHTYDNLTAWTKHIGRGSAFYTAKGN